MKNEMAKITDYIMARHACVQGWKERRRREQYHTEGTEKQLERVTAGRARHDVNRAGDTLPTTTPLTITDEEDAQCVTPP